MRRVAILATSGASLLAATLTPASVAAAPRVGTGVVAGVAGTGGDGDVWTGTSFHGAVRADLLWGREGVRDLGLGPALELSTVGFSDARFLAGPTLLVPFNSLVSLSLTPHGGARTDEGRWSAVAGGRALFGVRVFNHHGGYDLAGGLLAGFDRDLGSRGTSALVIGAQLDGLVLALPFVILAGWIQGAGD